MVGEFFAGLAALSFAVSGTAIAKSAAIERHTGDNGAFLSVILTSVFSFFLWTFFGSDQSPELVGPDYWTGIWYFLLAGFLATVIGRLGVFESVRLAGAINASIFRRLIPLFATILAFLILDESISWMGAAGIAVTLASILAVVFEKAPPGAVLNSRSGLRLGQFVGAASALSYAFAFVARKHGMTFLADPFLGVWVGSFAGILWYGAAFSYGGVYRDAVLHLFRDTRGWQFIAATAMSVGQICQFVALRNADVAIVSIIGSFEVFGSAYLAAYVFRTEAKPSATTIFATILATFGIALIVLS